MAFLKVVFLLQKHHLIHVTDPLLESNCKVWDLSPHWKYGI